LQKYNFSRFSERIYVSY